jgi:Bifunctional DNA primase/polymerase, N-terminal/Family of unknown function (DUF5906)
LAEEAMSNTTTDLRLQLLNAGYTPVPCQGKKVHLLEWTTVAIDMAEIERWEKKQHWDNTGIRTQYTPAFDIDITDEAAADAVAEKVQKKFEDNGQILVRTGKAPKRAIPFRTDQPFLKITRDFIAPNGSEQKIEFLGEGQQFVAFGIHPDTEQPYRWHGGDPSTVPLADLPYISSAEAYNLVDDVVVLLTKEFGYTLLSVRRNKTKQQSNGNDNITPGSFVWSSGFGAKKLKECCDRVREAKSHHWDEACRKVFFFGRLCGGGAYSPAEALKELLKAAAENTTAPDDYKFKIRETPSKVERSFLNGVADPSGPFLEEASLEDFLAYLPQHNYIYIPTRELWPAASINATIPSVDKDIKASTWLDQNRAVRMMTWAPGEEMLIRDRLIADGGWFDRPGDMCFNLYKPPTIKLGDASKAGPWLDLVQKVYPDDAEHIIKWCSHRIQRPGEKINHGLLMIGDPGIGKDTILEPVKYGVGPWNWHEVGPQALLGRFNGFLKSTVLRVNEARDLGEMNRYAFYEHTKMMMAAPPDILPVDEKNLREHSIINCVGVVITSNHLTGGIYLPADDRRHYVAYSTLTSVEFDEGYWTRLWKWYEQEGYRSVTAYLHEHDISMFDPKAPPEKTDAFWQIVQSNMAPENAELAEILDRLGNPEAVTIDQIDDKARIEFSNWLRDPKNCKAVPHRLKECGYVVVGNPDNKQGLWKVKGKKRNIYALKTLNVRDQLVAVEALRQEEDKPVVMKSPVKGA